MALQRRFPYETLLRVRQRQEDLRAQDVAAARREVNRAREQRDALTAEQMHALARAGQLSQGQFDASAIRGYYQYERHLAQLGTSKDAEIQGLQQRVEEKRVELEKATKARRVLEKLRERHQVNFAHEVMRLEQRTQDEVAGNYRIRVRRLEEQAEKEDHPWAD